MIFLDPKNLTEALARLDRGGPLSKLFKNSKATNGHFEDQEALDKILALREEFANQFPGTRCEPKELIRRIGIVEDLSKKLFEEFKFVEAVVFMGSALRGKVDPKDFDIAILTKAYDPELKLLNKYPTDVYAKTDVAKLEGFLNSNYQMLNGIRTQFTVEFNQDRFACFLPMIESGPYLAFVRVGKNKFKQFSNTSGTKYKDSRQP